MGVRRGRPTDGETPFAADDFPLLKPPALVRGTVAEQLTTLKELATGALEKGGDAPLELLKERAASFRVY